jgi:hypothetical protein
VTSAPVAGAGSPEALTPPTAGAGSAEAVAPPTAVATRADDDRPPIDDMFGDVEWGGFVIGEEGDEVMERPRFAPPGRGRSDEGAPS